jgi:prophage regulatory protein
MEASTMAVRFLGFADLKEMKGIRWSRMHIDRLEKAGLFPKRVRLGPKTIAWSEDEIDVFSREKLSHRGEAA